MRATTAPSGRNGPPIEIEQLSLWDRPQAQVSLAGYHLIAVNTSAGKDSVAMLVTIAAQARAEGVLDRVVAIHADLGVMEWPGTRELAQQQATAAGVTRFEMVARERGGAMEDLLGYALRHGKWPSSTARWCTSDLKRDPTEKLLRRLADQAAARPGHTGPVRVLTCYGMRAEESPARARKPQLEPYSRISTARRDVTRWLPVHSWTTAEVFAAGDAEGITRHPAYALGQSRASCVLCIFLSLTELRRAATLNPLLAQCYELVERTIGHRFRADVSLSQILADVQIPALPADTPLDPAQWAALIRATTRPGQIPPALASWAEITAWHTQPA